LLRLAYLDMSGWDSVAVDAGEFVMRASYTRPLLLVLPLLLLSSTASAHFDILTPPPASKAKSGKGETPCGPALDSGVVTSVQGGHEIDLSVDETVNHGGFYRVALSLGDMNALPADNTVYDKANNVLMPSSTAMSDHADYEMTPKFPVLADHLFAHEQSAAATKYMDKVMLPNVTCDKCILQVIEFMAPHGSNGAKAGFFYHNCANLKITADPALPAFDPSAPAGGAGGSGGAGGAGGAATAGGGGGGVATSGGVPTSGGAGAAAGGTPSSSAGGGASSGGTPSAAGSPTTSAGMAPTGTAGTGTADPASGAPPDDGGCGIAPAKGGAASALAALALLFAFGRRRRGAA
jgi:hypothetical protein